MSIGAIGYDVHSGLGHLMKDFYDHGVVDCVCIVPHSHYKRYGDWYPESNRYMNRKMRTYGTGLQFLDRISSLLLFENGFDWKLVAEAKRRGIRICLIPNYEYSPFPPPVTPDLVICASLLDRDYYKDYPHILLNIPVEQKWTLRERGLNFCHNAGHGQRGFAKGTPEVIKAMEYVSAPIKMRITGQPGERRIQQLFREQKDNPKLELVFGDFDKNYLFGQSDVFVNAEQYNGMSLMLQEAWASGMMVISTDRYPMNTWLPQEPLIPVDHYEKDRICVEFDRAVVDPKEIALKIDEFYDTDISKYSLAGKQWAEENSWDKLKPRYMEVLNG